ncbi:hypothetical protein RDI58_010230 [Solanum bulbocastanum]|uniref:Glycosyl hydrolase family 32 N-terminal domain-containing protein n=1 Tax=Solanum bulbocastanum TaxID=147425 RepID=A0AAN8TQK1_SOLBU
MIPNEEEKELFSHPTTAWLGSGGIWRVVIGNERENKETRSTLLYKSEDFIHWTEAEQTLHSSSETTMWECPDFFKIFLRKFGIQNQWCRNCLQLASPGHTFAD